MQTNSFMFCLRVILAATITLLALNPGKGKSQPVIKEILSKAAVDPAVPAPENFLGFEISQRPVHHPEVYAYFKALQNASSRVEFFEDGQSWEGRALFYIIISSRENIQRLAEIQNKLEKLSDARETRTAHEAESLIQHLPAVAMMMYSIHGDEISSTDAAVQLAYYLAASEDSLAKSIRSNLIVGIYPMENPDGRERYLSQVQQWNGIVPSADLQSMQHRGMWTRGRGNHYLFDLNRDWFIIAHPETRSRLNALLKWHPQLVVDSHEMGAYSSYFFPPPRSPILPLVHPKIRKWWKQLHKDQSAAFDKYSWSYQSEELFDEWYPGYGSSWPYFSGAVAILYEQARTDGTQVKRPDGTTLTFADAIQHHFVSSLANLTTVARGRREILSDYFQIRQQALQKPGENENAVFYIVPGANAARAEHLVRTLAEQGIEVEVADSEFRASQLRNPVRQDVTSQLFPAGTFIIRTAQPQGLLVRALLNWDFPMPNKFLQEEREHLFRKNETLIYDVSGWSVLLAYNLNFFASSKTPAVKSHPFRIDQPREPFQPVAASNYGYILDPRDDRSIKALAKLLEKKMMVRAALESITVGGAIFPRGLLVVRNSENPGPLQETLSEIARQTGAVFLPAGSAHTQKGPDLGGEKFRLLTQPRVALITGAGIQLTQFGALWYLFDKELQMQHTLLDYTALNSADLRKYNVLILPDSYGNHDSYRRILPEKTLQKITNWVENGGTLIAIGNAAAFLADSAVAKSQVRLRRQVLDKLPLYQTVFSAEQKWKTPHIDSLTVWSNRESPITTPEVKFPAKPQVQFLKKQDERFRQLQPRGAILLTVLDVEHYLSLGLDSRLPVIFNSSYAYLSMPPVQVAARFTDARHLRLAGLLWPEARLRWENSAYVTVEKKGNGQIILFADEPFFRAYFYGSARLFLNAVLLGPGLGAEAPVPW